MSERERQISYGITYMWTLKYDTYELIQEIEADSQTKRADYVITKRGRVEEAYRLGAGDQHMQTIRLIYRIDKKRSYCVAQGTIFIICDKQ